MEIVDLGERVRNKNKEPGAPANVGRVYEVLYQDGRTDQVSGVLMLTGAFFAVGIPLADGTGVDFSWAAPVEQVTSVTALEDDDLTDD